jgi:hypothetical protein
MKYYGMINEITDLSVNNFPTKFPMFFLGDQLQIDEYNRLMLKSMSLGFDPKVRKLCFTLGCKEGFTHEDIFNLIKDLPEIDEERYILLKNIIHWDPVVEATKVMSNYILLVEAAQESPAAEAIKEHFEQAFNDAREANGIKCYAD